MAFGKTTQKSNEGNISQDTIYLKLTGERIIRILDVEETEYWRYFINVNVGGKKVGRSITIGSKRDSPIAHYMDNLGKEHPEYRAIQHRMLLNVLDRTPVKCNSLGGIIYPDDSNKFPDKDPITSENITNSPIVPNNKVLVIEFGAELMKHFMVLHERIRHNITFEPLPIQRFDVKVITTGSGKDISRFVMADYNQEPLPEELKALNKYDLRLFTRQMPAEYQTRILAGEDFNELLKELGWDRPKATIPQE